MKKIILILIALLNIHLFAHTREMQVQVVSGGSPIIKTIELYKADAGFLKLYRTGSSTNYWKWTGPNANVVCDIEDNNTPNPTWAPIDAGSYYIKIDNKYASLYINPNWEGSIDFLMKYDGTFTMIDGNPYVSLGSTQTWNKVTAEFKQFKSDGTTSVGTVAMGQGSSFSQRYTAPSDFYIDKNENYLFHADTNITSSQKYHNYQNVSDVTNFRNQSIGTLDYSTTAYFNSTYSGVTIKNYLLDDGNNSGNIKFQDPWLIDYRDPSHGNHRRNRGADDALFTSRTSPFNPDYSTGFGGNTYKGVFLNQTVSSGNYYSVQALLTQTINGHTSYFQNWSTSGATVQQVGSNPSGYDQKAVVFTSSSAVITANYKGHLYTNSSTATTTNSQRKIVQSSSGDWAMVYTSSNKIWLSLSTDGTNWDGEVKISDDPYVDGYPSIALDGNTAYIVWQAIDWAGGTGFDFGAIYMRSYNLSTGALGSTVTVQNFTPNIEAFQANPVIDVGITNEEKMIAWRESNGIKVRYYDNHDGWSNITSVTGTNSSSYNPSIADYNGYVYVLCWEDNANHKIKFTKATYSQTISFSTTEEVSPTNWESNGKPQIVMGYLSKPTVVWSSRNNVAEGIPSVHFRQKSSISGTWGTITSFSYSTYSGAVLTPVIGNYISNNKVDILWNVGNTVYKGSYNGSSWSGPTTVTSSGGTGVNINQNTSYQTKAVWKKSDNTIAFYNIGGTPPPKSSVASTEKETPLAYRLNRHAIIELNKNLDSTALGSVCFEIAGMSTLLNDIEMKINYSQDTLNLLSSEPFKIEVPGMELKFRGAIYGKGLEVSQNFISSLNKPLAKVVLKDSKTGEILKDIWTNNPSMLNSVKDKTFGEFRETDVNLNNFLGKTVYVEVELLGKSKGVKPIIVNDYLILSDSAVSNNELNKQVISYNLPGDYTLMQNYPNPFNPSTTISFYLPKSDHVTLKVFNTLGKEIITAANENMEEGYHAVNLDMSNEPSGIYFYTLTAGNFTNTKKLMLLK